MSGKMARRKGANYEREIANKLKPIFPDAKRHLEYQFQEAQGFDIDNTDPYKIQCKRGRKYASITKIEEVKEAGIPVLITKGDNKRDVACLYLEDFIRLLEIEKKYNEK